MRIVTKVLVLTAAAGILSGCSSPQPAQENEKSFNDMERSEKVEWIESQPEFALLPDDATGEDFLDDELLTRDPCRDDIDQDELREELMEFESSEFLDNPTAGMTDENIVWMRGLFAVSLRTSTAAFCEGDYPELDDWLAENGPLVR